MAKGGMEMKKYILLFSLAMFLIGCGNETENNATNQEEQKRETTETVISEREYNITLIDNDDFKMTLKESKHIRIENYEEKDNLYLTLNIENKQNRTYTILLRNLYLDGDGGDWSIGMSETEVKPNETIDISVSLEKDILSTDKLISLEEHIKGEVLYSDYERSRLEDRFSEYINE